MIFFSKHAQRVSGCIAIILLLAAQAFSQDNPCTMGWGQWHNVYTFGPNVDFRISFNYQVHNRKGGDCGQSYYRIDNPVIRKDAWLKFKFDYKKGDGTVGTETCSYELDKTGTRGGSTGSGSFYFGYEIVSIHDVQYVDPQKDKAKSLSANINSAISDFNTAYQDVNRKVSNISDAQKRASAQQRLANINSTFLQYRQQAQAQLNNGEGDAMDETLQKINGQKSEVLNLMNDYREGTYKAQATPAGAATGAGNTTQAYHYTTQPGNQPKASTPTYAQQFQQQQNRNAQTQQTINNVFDNLKNQVQQVFDQRQKEREEQYERDKQQREQREQEDKARQEERDRQLQAELAEARQKAVESDRQMKLDEQITDLNNLKTVGREQIPDNVKEVFYIVYFRDRQSNKVTVTTYQLNKYSDDTWMLLSDVRKKINFQGAINEYYTNLLIGAFLSREAAFITINHIKANTDNPSVDAGFTPVNAAPAGAVAGTRAVAAVNNTTPALKTQGNVSKNTPKPRIITLPDGVKCEALEWGNTGKKPQPADQVEIGYITTLENGKEVDNSYKRNEPTVVAPNGVIEGLKEALLLMEEGDKFKIFIPGPRAYGTRADSPLPPNTSLIIVLKLIKVTGAPGKPAADKDFWNN